MKKTLLIGLLALLSGPAFAQSQDDLLVASLLPGWKLDNGHHMAGLNLTLAPHWKTYWRAPGESGIPPQFDWSGSQNVKSVTLHWPSPEVISLNGLQSIGYLDQLLLPLEVTARDPGKPIELQLEMQLGICKDICLPASLSLTTVLDETTAKDAQIVAALNKGPMTAAQAGLHSIGCDVLPTADGLHIAARMGLPKQGNPETVVFETADASVWVAKSTASRVGAVLTAASDLVPVSGTPFALDRSGVIVTVIGQGHSVEIKGCPAP
jgi:DsbC/DsbD-like thiol-disulfide interchange protein